MDLISKRVFEIISNIHHVAGLDIFFFEINYSTNSFYNGETLSIFLTHFIQKRINICNK